MALKVHLNKQLGKDGTHREYTERVFTSMRNYIKPEMPQESQYRNKGQIKNGIFYLTFTSVFCIPLKLI